MKPARLAATVGVAVAVVGAFCFVPLPYHITCAFEVQPNDPHSVYAGTPGQIVEIKKRPGDRIQQGETLAVLRNPQLELKLAKLQGDELVAKARLESLKFLRRIDSAYAGNVEMQEEVVRAAGILRSQGQEEFEELNITAPVSGVVIPPPDKSKDKPSDGRLPEWSGSPLDIENTGALLTQESLLCMIGDPTNVEAVLVIDQSDIQLIDVGDAVELMADAKRLEAFEGTIDKIARSEMKYAPSSLATQAGGQLESEVDPETGNMRPLNTSYQARVPLPAGVDGMRVGYRGTAKIKASPKSLGWRFYRFLNKTFNFDL